MNQQKHIHLARRKMSHVIDELYTALLLAGGKRVTLEITKEPEGLRLVARGGFDGAHRRQVERMAEMLQPAVRNPALVEEFWELAGGDQYTSDSELALVGQMVDRASAAVGEGQVELDLFIAF